jgi:exodeoxyribonuclease VII large subunit
MAILNVSQLARYVKSILESDEKLKELYIRGELTNLSDHFSSGHLYFTLKDKDASVRCVCFKTNAAHLKFSPQNGMSVIVRGNAAIYERDCVFQVYVSEILPDGLGAFGAAFEKLKQKLGGEGLFDTDKKKKIPDIVNTVGIVTSPTGAALQDIISVFERRQTKIHVKVSPASVQGSQASGSINRALLRLMEHGCDLVIICRGGGSMEDLWAFNEESIVRNIYEIPVPTISAIGHETDYTLCDMVCDIRAATPTAAAEMVADVFENKKKKQLDIKNKLFSDMKRRISYEEQRLNAFILHPVFQFPSKIIDNRCQELYNCKKQLNYFTNLYLSDLRSSLLGKMDLLETLSPLKVLMRGYSITLVNGLPVGSIESITKRQTINTRIADGWIESTVTDTKKEN